MAYRSEDGFTVVNRRKKGKSNKCPSILRQKKSYGINDLDDESGNENELNDKLQIKLRKYMETLTRIRFVEKVTRAISNYSCKETSPSSENNVSSIDTLTNVLDKCSLSQFDQIVSYGIGRFSSSRESLYQLSLLLILKNENILTANEWLMYDPIFTDREKKFLSGNGFKVLNENEKGARSVTSPTFFYMPHCPLPMYNNLMWANWSFSNLSKTVLLGTSFKSLVDTFIDLDQQREYSYLVNTIEANLVNEYSLDPPRDIYEAFNDLSIHIFKPEANIFTKIDPKHKPTYSDTVFSKELVVN